MVEHSPHQAKVEGLSPEKIAKEVCVISSFENGSISISSFEQTSEISFEKIQFVVNNPFGIVGTIRKHCCPD